MPCGHHTTADVHYTGVWTRRAEFLQWLPPRGSTARDQPPPRSPGTPAPVRPSAPPAPVERAVSCGAAETPAREPLTKPNCPRQKRRSHEPYASFVPARARTRRATDAAKSLGAPSAVRGLRCGSTASRQLPARSPRTRARSRSFVPPALVERAVSYGAAETPTRLPPATVRTVRVSGARLNRVSRRLAGPFRFSIKALARRRGSPACSSPRRGAAGPLLSIAPRR